MGEGRTISADTQGYKQVVLRLRWVTIIITSYLILFGRGITAPQYLPSLLILFYLSSNLVAHFLPSSYFSRLSFFYIVLLFDTLMVSLGIYITSQFDTDFYLVYFLIILFASVARSFKLLMINALVICGIYGWFLWTKGWNIKSLEEGILLRIPFIFIMNIFYGFLIQSFEEKTRQMKKDLREVEESELRYRQIVEGAHDAVAILDEEGRIKFFNGRLPLLTRYTPQELTGMEWVRVMNGACQDEIMGAINRSPDPEGALITHETDVTQKSGGKRRVEVSRAQLSLPAGKAHTIIYLKDITDKKQLEGRLIQSEKLKALGEMAAGVAHDLNNVLGAILGRAQLLNLGLTRRKGDSTGISDETVRKELGIIEQAARDGAHTIKKIREFSSPKTDESKFVLLNANELMEGTLELVKPKIKDEAEEKGIPINVQMVPGELLWVMGNPSELKEVLLNVVLNSIDALPQGGTITLRVRRNNGYASIEVSDNGIGIPSSIKGCIFDPFFTTKGLQRSGLGLSISYGIIQRHRGEIQVESQEGIGTTFTIQLPIVKQGGLL
jgi:PAS domain S-box-containing protein